MTTIPVPCWFRGAAAKRHRLILAKPGRGLWCVACETCGANGPIVASQTKAVALWNDAAAGERCPSAPPATIPPRRKAGSTRGARVQRPPTSEPVSPPPRAAGKEDGAGADGGRAEEPGAPGPRAGDRRPGQRRQGIGGQDPGPVCGATCRRGACGRMSDRHPARAVVAARPAALDAATHPAPRPSATTAATTATASRPQPWTTAH